MIYINETRVLLDSYSPPLPLVADLYSQNIQADRQIPFDQQTPLAHATGTHSYQQDLVLLL